MGIATVPVMWLRELNRVLAPGAHTRVTLLVLLFAVTLSLYSAVFAVLTHLTLRHLDRASLLGIARQSRLRQNSRALRPRRCR